MTGSPEILAIPPYRRSEVMAMGVTFRSAPEFRSVEAFVEMCIDDERTEFTHDN